MITAFLPDSVKLVLVSVIAAVLALAGLARLYPDVTWLRPFRFEPRRVTEAEKRRHRRAAQRAMAIEMLLAGAILPIAYVALTVMMFNDFNALPTILVAATAVLCIGGGIWILARER